MEFKLFNSFVFRIGVISTNLDEEKGENYHSDDVSFFFLPVFSGMLLNYSVDFFLLLSN